MIEVRVPGPDPGGLILKPKVSPPSLSPEILINKPPIRAPVRDKGASEGMKPLLPTLKERQRYVLYEVISTHAIDNDISDALLHRLSEILGIFGMADAGVLSVSYDSKTKTGILRCNHDQVVRVKAALTMVTHIGKTPVIIRIRGVSGVLAKAKRFLPSEARRTTKETTKGLRAIHS
jgi:ribonuclease P/MRP protein subunit POP5